MIEHTIQNNRNISDDRQHGPAKLIPLNFQQKLSHSFLQHTAVQKTLCCQQSQFHKRTHTHTRQFIYANSKVITWFSRNVRNKIISLAVTKTLLV